MAFTQTVVAEEGGFYPGTQIEQTPSNATTFITQYSTLQSDIPPVTQSLVRINDSPLTFQVPAGTDLVVGLTINGVYTEDFIYDPDAGTITVNNT